MSDVEFVPGLIVKLPPDNAPDYIIGKLSINIDNFKDWLSSKDGEWVNIDLKIAKSGKAYAAVDNWKPNASAQRPAQRAPAQSRAPRGTSDGRRADVGSGFDDMDDDIPF